MLAVNRKRILTFFAVCLFAAVVSARYAGYLLIASDKPQAADLILVIGGDFFGPRVLKAADLAVQGYAPLVLISGPPYRDKRPEGEFAIDFLISRGYPRHLFQAYGVNANSTIPEAVTVGQELTKRSVHRVILVTSSYHSRRARLVYGIICPEIHFTSVPADDCHYDPKRWWTGRSRRLFFSECAKITGSWIFAYRERLAAYLNRM